MCNIQDVGSVGSVNYLVACRVMAAVYTECMLDMLLCVGSVKWYLYILGISFDNEAIICAPSFCIKPCLCNCMCV